MNKRERKTLSAFAGLAIALMVYIAVRLLGIDAALVVPGWHTVIYPKDITFSILAVVILLASLAVYLFVCGSIKLLTPFGRK
jgi:hypothetical protein